MRKMSSLHALAFAATTLVATAVSAAEPVKIRLAWVVPVSNWATMLAEKLDMARNNGKTYTFEAVRFQGTPPMITALAVNEIDVGLLNFSSIGLGIQNAGMDDLRIFAGEFQDGVPGKYSNRYFVRKDSGITKASELKGKIIAINAAGGCMFTTSALPGYPTGPQLRMIRIDCSSIARDGSSIRS